MTDKEYIELAINSYASDGEIEFDSEPLVSPSDEGAYVQAWVWVSNPEPSEREKEQCIS